MEKCVLVFNSFIPKREGEDMLKVKLEKGQGCSLDEWTASQGGHSYATWNCSECGEEICWNCAVRCTNNSTGEGEITCPYCGYEDGEYTR